MPELKKTTAVLLFALSSEEEVKRKSYLSIKAHQKLTNRAIYIAKKSGLDFFHFTEKEQRGNTFGERFTNAIQDVYNKGYDAVITIGNDTPGLSVSNLKRTYLALQKNQVVLGPSLDGGFYLMGLPKTFFEQERFINLAWNTTSIRSEVQQLINNYTCDQVELNYLIDIDDLNDIYHIIPRLHITLKKIISVLQSLLEQSNFTFEIVKKEIRFFQDNNANRGSPSVG